MKQLEVFNKIGGIIKELNDQYKYLEDSPENLNDLELELFVANAHFLADHAEILSKLSQRTKAEKPAAQSKTEPAKIEQPKIEQPKSIVVEKFFEPVVQQPRREPKQEVAFELPAKPIEEPAPQIDLMPAAPADTYSFERGEPEVIRHELVVEDIDDTDEEPYEEPVYPSVADEKIWAAEEIKEEEPPAKIAVPELPNVTVTNEPKIPIPELPRTPVKEEEIKPVVKVEEVAEKKDEPLTINQRISSQMAAKANFTEQAGAQPIADLKKAITLNDKLLFIKDLFNGYSLAYSEAIEILNRFNNFEEADRFLNKNYVVKNNWEAKPITTERFFALLKRRYS